MATSAIWVRVRFAQVPCAHRLSAICRSGSWRVGNLSPSSAQSKWACSLKQKTFKLNRRVSTCSNLIYQIVFWVDLTNVLVLLSDIHIIFQAALKIRTQMFILFFGASLHHWLFSSEKVIVRLTQINPNKICMPYFGFWNQFFFGGGVMLRNNEIRSFVSEHGYIWNSSQIKSSFFSTTKFFSNPSRVRKICRDLNVHISP